MTGTPSLPTSRLRCCRSDSTNSSGRGTLRNSSHTDPPKSGAAPVLRVSAPHREDQRPGVGARKSISYWSGGGGESVRAWIRAVERDGAPPVVEVGAGRVDGDHVPFEAVLQGLDGDGVPRSDA